ncbi:hypothetical protein MKX01_012024 [Papaver californicum]|nr:hypothetical protein MKX01_012024 [Papaver californicum]
MFPILASTIIMNTCLAQLQTFSAQQGLIMDLNLGSFVVPAPSIPVIPLLFMSIIIPLYKFIFVPFARKITKHPSGITQLQRVGVGLVLSAVSMAVAAIVEVKRRDQAIDNPLKPISLFWLSFQYGIFGIADMFTLVGLLEFFYKEAPSHMRSLSTSFTWFLTILSCLNFANYLYWSSWYKYKTVDDSDVDADTFLSEPKVLKDSKNGPLELIKEKANATCEDSEANKSNVVTSSTTNTESTIKENEDKDKHDE